MLVNPRAYRWNLVSREPFVTNETSPYFLESLRAGDGHAIPFPHRVLEWEQYWHSDTCRVTLFIQDGNSPHRGASYVMEIVLSGYNRTISQEVEYRMRRWIPTPSHFRGGPVDVALRILTVPALGSGESHWDAPATLVADVSTEQVGQRRDERPSEARVRVTATFRTVTIHYNLLFPRVS